MNRQNRKEKEHFALNNRNKRSNPESGLYHAILQLRDLNECYDFFTDLCTAGELKAMEQRI